MSEAALRYCEDLTRREARNFWYGIRLLPPPKRRALAAVYAMARRIDDIGDDEGPPGPERRAALGPGPERRAALDRVEASLAMLAPAPAAAPPEEGDPVLAALRTVARRFPLPVEAFGDLVAGVRMDLDGTRYATFDQLVVYCRRVAGSIGRLSLAVFGPTGDPVRAAALADDLGVAMQLVNVLRDVREDLARGRVYVPEEDLARFGCSPGDLGRPGAAGAVALIRFEAERAASWFERGLPLLSMLDRRSAGCAGGMAGIYLRLLRRVAADPVAVLAGRVTLPSWEKALCGARALATGRAGSTGRGAGHARQGVAA